MSIINMSRFGPILTGREFGQKALKELPHGIERPVALDFSGVISLGSSFGDEFVPALARTQGGEIQVLNANEAVLACLLKVAEESKIRISAG